MSVIVPAFNAAGTLARAVQSALRARSGVRVEIIIVDDGSTDGTGAVADGLAARHAQVRVVHQPNRGLSAARNAGLDVVSGDRVVFLDADDELLPGGLEALSSALDAGAPAAVGGFVMRAPDGDEVGRVGAPPGGLGLDELLGLHFTIVPAVMLEASLAREERFDPARRRVEDYDLWLRLALRDRGRFRLAGVDASVCAYHLSPGAMSTDFEGMLTHGQDVIARAFSEARARPVAGVDASEAREHLVLSSLALSWATRAAVVEGVTGAGISHGLARAEALVRRSRVQVRVDAERAAGHAVSAVQMGLAQRPLIGNAPPVWLEALLAWWWRALSLGWLGQSTADEGTDTIDDLLARLSERLVEPEEIAGAMIVEAGAAARGMVVAGLRANGRLLAHYAARRGVRVRVRDERSVGGVADLSLGDVPGDPAEAPIEPGWLLVLTNRDPRPFGAPALAHRVRGGTVLSWYAVRARLAADTLARLRVWALRHANDPACPAA